MQSIELELTYLARTLPDDLYKYPSKKVVDAYFPVSASHPTLRLRQSGNIFEITKKLMAAGTDSSHMIEHTIVLDDKEFADLTKQGGKKVIKQRYFYNYQGRTAEFDIFAGDLQGLVLIDFEFANRNDQLSFAMPDFCLAEVTQEAFIAGGVLAGKTYSDIASDLLKYAYKPLTLRGADE